MEKSLQKRLFDLVVFLLTSARGLLDEPHIYGSTRLLEAARRVLELQEEALGHDGDTFLGSIKIKLDKREYSPSSKLSTPEGRNWFASYLDGIIVDFVREAKRRNKPPSD